MPTVDVFDNNKRKVGSVQLKDDVFGVTPNKALLYTAVVMQRACARQGTASVLRRGEVSGSGKKPWKQKHTGRARAGSIRSPIWRHGGSVFGPKPRDYGYSIPKKQYRAALRSALSAKLASGEVLIVSDLAIAQPKTRLLAKILDQLGMTGTTLIVMGEGRTDLERAAGNLSGVTLLAPHQLNVYDVLRCQVLIIPERELARVHEAWS
jgi:large subunit ribosomal protein L4